MRALALPFAVLAFALVAGVGSVAQAVDVRMSLEALPTEGKVALEAGGIGPNDPFHIGFDFESDGQTLGKPAGVGLQLLFGAYCRDRASWVEAVLIDPAGRRWPAHRVGVPAGPDRRQDWSSGYLDDPALIDAVEAGGAFTLALQDDEGRLWNSVVIDTPSPAQRLALFEAGRAAPAEAAPGAGDGLVEVIEQAPVAMHSSPRPCPTS